MPALIGALRGVGIDAADGELHDIFFSEPPKTKLEQFYRLLYFIQRQKGQEIPVQVTRPNIAEVLLAARVFRDDAFPNKMVAVTLAADGGRGPRYVVHFEAPEVRFPLNGGVGFAVWDRGMCQTARELVFQNGFSFRLKESGENLVVEDFDKVELFGGFGNRGIFDIDLNYVALERVEFLAGTDQGKVKSRVAPREFATNPHSFLFKWIGRLIPDNSRQRIDW